MAEPFWKWAKEEWRKGNFDITDLWLAYERMTGKSIAGAHFIGKMMGITEISSKLGNLLPRKRIKL